MKKRREPDAGRITQDAALFVLLHEIGHSFLADRQVPFLGREEDAADEIAALLAIDRHFPDIIDAGAQFFELDVTERRRER